MIDHDESLGFGVANILMKEVMLHRHKPFKVRRGLASKSQINVGPGQYHLAVAGG